MLSDYAPFHWCQSTTASRQGCSRIFTRHRGACNLIFRKVIRDSSVDNQVTVAFHTSDVWTGPLTTHKWGFATACVCTHHFGDKRQCSSVHVTIFAGMIAVKQCSWSVHNAPTDFGMINPRSNETSFWKRSIMHPCSKWSSRREFEKTIYSKALSWAISRINTSSYA